MTRLQDLPDAMEVTVGIWGCVVIHYDVHTLHINTTTKNIGCNQNTFLEGLECRVAANTGEGEHTSDRLAVTLVVTLTAPLAEDRNGY